MTTMSLARIAQVLQRDFRSTANQLRQEGKVVRDKSQSCVDAAYTLDRLAATVSLDLSPKALERHHASNHFQRIALHRNRRKPPVRIEESKLSHRPHTRESCCYKSDSHKFAEVAIFRGAL